MNFMFVVQLYQANLPTVLIKGFSVLDVGCGLGGFYGSENSGNNLNINSEYGGVTLTKH
ncbi:MAG: hypothetical protein L3J09_02820 [Flavobacteriaceae bacterium]|nr:hypothetical protein [Flavobacteriaceae bacterium]